MICKVIKLTTSTSITTSYYHNLRSQTRNNTSNNKLLKQMKQAVLHYLLKWNNSRYLLKLSILQCLLVVLVPCSLQSIIPDKDRKVYVQLRNSAQKDDPTPSF